MFSNYPVFHKKNMHMLRKVYYDLHSYHLESCHFNFYNVIFVRMFVHTMYSNDLYVHKIFSCFLISVVLWAIFM